VAGLTRNAHPGEGLGNRFLASLRECDAVCHVVRAFEDESDDNNDSAVVHVDGRVDPVEDADLVNLELVLADLAHVERRLEKTACVGLERETLERIGRHLQNGVPARAIDSDVSDEGLFLVKGMGLLTLKPVLYAFNVDESDFFEYHRGRRRQNKSGYSKIEQYMQQIQYCDPNVDRFTAVSARVEMELSELEKDEQVQYLANGLEEISGGAPPANVEDTLSCNSLPTLVCALLDLCLVYTGPGVAPERSRTTKSYLLRRPQSKSRNISATKGGPISIKPTTNSGAGTLTTAYDLAGRIHGDVQRGFVRAEVASADVLLSSMVKEGNDNDDDSNNRDQNYYARAVAKGIVRTEGKEYVLQPNDVVLIKWKSR